MSLIGLLGSVDLFPKGVPKRDTMSEMATESRGRRLRRTLTDEFKAGAVRLVLEICGQLGIAPIR
jgi:transposase-like protein